MHSRHDGLQRTVPRACRRRQEQVDGGHTGRAGSYDLCTSVNCDAADGNDRHAREAAGGREPLEPQPVSYTHLTLPTNREV